MALLRVTWRSNERLTSSFMMAVAVAALTALQLGVDLSGIWWPDLALQSDPYVSLLFVVSPADHRNRWTGPAAQPVQQAQPRRAGRACGCSPCGLAGLFGYDLNLYTLQFLFGEIPEDLFNIRGAVDVLVVPLLLLSTRQAWVSRLQVSRQVAFHTLSMSIIGGYLIVMAMLAYGLRLLGGNWGALLQISFLCATIILGAVVLFSPRFRAALRVQIAKNFYTYKYDYRQEWLRFINTVAHADAGAGTLAERVIEAVCAVVDSPGGSLYAPDDSGCYEVSARWNSRAVGDAAVQADSTLARFLSQRQRIVDLDQLRQGRGDYDDLELPEWAVTDRRAWLIVPLMHLDHLAGFIVLDRTVAQRSLNWEDFDLLRTLGRQAASYIAEASTQAGARRSK